jgi:hypothetical protein
MMTTTMPSRTQIENASEMEWSTPRTKAEPLTITVHAVVAGFATELCFTGTVEQLPALAARLVALGATPTATPATHTAPLNGTRKAATATYADDGTPLCSNANCSRCGQPLEPSQHNGYYCKGKDSRTGNAKGYCKSTAD